MTGRHFILGSRDPANDVAKEDSLRRMIARNFSDIDLSWMRTQVALDRQRFTAGA
jgi:hypothetical protein